MIAKSTTAEPWRVGILFSRSGFTSVSESEHFFGTVLAIEEINAAGGVLGRLIEPVVLDPKSDPSEYRRCAEQMLLDDGVSVIFGCSTSSTRKAVLPVIERCNGLLWYCSLYEGFEFSPNVIYTGAAPNQNSLQLAAYLLREGYKRWYLIGSDYIYPRESNRIMRDMVEQHGGEITTEKYLPTEVNTGALATAVLEIKAAAPDVVFSTLVGRPGREFYRLYRELGIHPANIPIASLTMAEGEIESIDANLCQGHITSATYFSSIDTPENIKFVKAFRTRFGPTAPVSMWSEGAYSQVHLFARALARAGTLDTQKLVRAALEVSYDAPSGELRLDPDNQHAWLRPRIGRIQADGSFDIIWDSRATIKPDPYLTLYGMSDLFVE